MSKKKYSKKDLVSFGNHVLSYERTASVQNVESLRSVTDADIENWKQENK